MLPFHCSNTFHRRSTKAVWCRSLSSKSDGQLLLEPMGVSDLISCRPMVDRFRYVVLLLAESIEEPRGVLIIVLVVHSYFGQVVHRRRYNVVTTTELAS
ncbi:hypothetical protein M513_09123 [Trichuris suis]|uniref:Uncharacterized protein n=1 Tax=Trichuris suis TaxID=68888 RepID=A0A085LYI4_9BILA|nr:hypothetical protein M513_09123 [Trichuris suis]